MRRVIATGLHRKVEDRVQEKNGKESRSAEGKEVMNGCVQLCVFECFKRKKKSVS